MKKLITKEINPLNHIERAEDLILQLNDKRTKAYIRECLKEMVKFDTYTCFGLFEDDELIGLSSGWTTVKIYSGKQLEVDNVIIDGNIQSQGFGKKMFADIEAWAKERGYKSVELNTYVANSRSHKFYFNQGYYIGGYHFRKEL